MSTKASSPAWQVPVPAMRNSPPPSSELDRNRLNLDFEKVEAGQPVGWVSGIAVGGAKGEGASDSVVVHGGAASYRLVTGTSDFGSSVVTLDATDLRGKRVRLHGWVKTDAVDSGWAGVWLRVDDGATGFDNMAGRGVTGTAEWREAVATVDVAEGASRIALGPLIVGSGTAWFDDLTIEVADAPKPHPITLNGVAVDDGGTPVPGADVTVFSKDGQPVGSATTGDGGRFSVDVTSGKLSVSATKVNLVGGFLEPQEFEADVRDLRLVMPRTGGVEVVATLAGGVAAVPADVQVVAGPYSKYMGDIFALKLAPDRTFRATLPRGDQYNVRLWQGEQVSYQSAKRAGDRADVQLVLDVRLPAPAAVRDWLSASATRVATADPTHDLDDLSGLERIVGKAHIVGLGEATHGTREFFQMKHRIVRYLVERMGFTVFAIEANQPECRAINDYVLRGVGDPREGLNGIYFWVWNTEEVLDLIEWLRMWNADPRHKRKVQFIGIDMQYTKVAAASVATYVMRVAPDEAERLLAGLQGDADGPRRLAVPALVARFEQMAKAWTKVTGKVAYAEARQDLRVLEQEAAMEQAAGGGYAERDRAMADNLDWILAQQPKGTRVAVWAHNDHVANDAAGWPVMGAHLRQRHGKDYVNLGFVFGSGSFQAMDATKGQRTTVIEFSLDPAPPHDVSAPFTQVGQPILIADLRAAPAGAVADWFAAPHTMRDTGYLFTSEAAMTRPVTLSRLFDAVIFVDKTTRARPLPGGERPRRDVAPSAGK